MAARRTRKLKSSEMLAPLPGGIQARAEAKVGSTNLARLGWLLALLNRPPENAAPENEQERVDLEAQVAAFAKPIGRAAGDQRSQLNRNDIVGLVRNLRESIRAMVDGATLEIEIPKLIFISAADSPAIYLGPPKAIFRLAVAKLVEAEQWRIRICARPGCGKLFVRRKQALFCSRQCSQVEQFKRYVARHSSTN